MNGTNLCVLIPLRAKGASLCGERPRGVRRQWLTDEPTGFPHVDSVLLSNFLGVEKVSFRYFAVEFYIGYSSSDIVPRIFFNGSVTPPTITTTQFL